MAEPKRPSIEAILTDIHNTLVEGFTDLTDSVNKLIEVSLTQPMEKVVVRGKVEQVITDPHSEDAIPKFVQEWVEAHPGCTAADVVREHKISENRARAAVKQYGKDLPKPMKEKIGKITVEQMRAKVSEFAETFSMNDALALNEKFGGARKLSEIPEVKYEAVFTEMEKRLKEKAEPAPEVIVTKEDVQKAAGVFVKKYGDPAFRELLAKFVGKGDEAKISKVDPAKYAALVEALDNA
jgi:hypothetical protein